MFISLLKVVVNGEDCVVLVSPVKSLLFGASFYHMWYMYMMIGVYVLTPLLVNVVRKM